MGSGPKTTTTSTNTQNSGYTGTNSQQQSNQTNSQATSTTNPNLPDWLLPFRQQIAQQYGNLYGQFGQMAQSPLYGPQQQATFQQGLNQSLGAAQQNATSALARSGALNSGRAANVDTALQLGGANDLQKYLASIPMLNAQYKQGALGAQAGILNNASNLTVPYGQTTSSASWQDMLSNLLNQTSGTADQSGSSTETKQTSGGLLQSVLGGLLNAGMGFLSGGLTNITGGGGFFSPKPQ